MVSLSFSKFRNCSRSGVTSCASGLISIRKFSSKKQKKTATPETAQGGLDIYGPPDPVSNIQTVRFFIPPDESETEKRFRLQRGEVLEWNHQFWAKHNTKFFKEKGEFIQNMKLPDKDEDKKSARVEQMSVFYRRFLEENREEHLSYNKEWYKKNFSLLWPAFLVYCIRLKRRFSGKATT